MPKRRQAGRAPNASRNPEALAVAPAFGVRELAPAFGGAASRGRGRGRCQSAGKPDALQTLRGTRRHLLLRQRLECGSLLPLLEARLVVDVVVGDAKAPASRTHSKRFAEPGGTCCCASVWSAGACSRFWRRG